MVINEARTVAATTLSSVLGGQHAAPQPRHHNPEGAHLQGEQLSVAPSAWPRLIYGNICAAADSVDRAAAPIPRLALALLGPSPG